MKTHLYESEKGHLSLFDQLLLRYGILKHVEVRWVDYFSHPLDLETEIECKIIICELCQLLVFTGLITSPNSSFRRICSLEDNLIVLVVRSFLVYILSSK